MIQPHEIMIGSCFNQVIDNFEPCTPKPIIWNETNWYRIGECIEFLEWFEPIPITEKILMEWCGFEKWKDNIFRKSWGRNGVHFITIFPDGLFYYETGNNTYRNVEPLHHLQMLVQSLSNQPLKIGIT